MHLNRKGLAFLLKESETVILFIDVILYIVILKKSAESVIMLLEKIGVDFMNKSKKVLLLIAVVTIFILTLSVTSSANTSSDFSYTFLDYDGTVRIDRYKGSATYIEIPSNIDGYRVTIIGNNAFEDNDNLISVTIPDTVTTIYKEAFAYCSNLQNITLPNSIEMIYYRAFRDCNNLKNMYYEGTADEWVKIIFDGCDTNPMYYAENEYFNDELVTNITFIEDIDEICEYAFYNCTNLESITLPEGVRYVWTSAFWGCSNLKTIIIPDSLYIVSNYAFENCNNLWHVLYEGTESRWNNISIGSNNSCITNVTRHYEVTSNPITERITPPTCTENGYTTYTCECGESYVDHYVKETGHTHNKVVIPPTCTEQGYTTYTCECGDTYIDNYVEKIEHSFGDWFVIKESTVDTEGKMERACSCGQKEYKSIDKLPVVENDNNSKEENIKKEDVKNPEIPDTNVKTTNIFFVFMLMSFVITIEIVFLSQKKRYLK